MKAGEVEEAGHLVDDFIAQHPDDWTGYFLQGLLWNLTGQFRESIQAYERAIDLNPNALEPHYNILNSWRGLGDLHTPLRRYETLVQDAPFDPVLRTALGRAFGLSGHHDEAIRHLREAVRLDPQSYMTRLSLAQELFKKAMSLLSTDWFTAWAYFEECSTSFLHLIDMDEARRPNSYALAGESFEQMAIESYFVQPALFSAKMDTKELIILGYAASFYRKCIELAPHLSRPREGYARVIEAILRFADASGLTTAGAVLRNEGEENEALLFLEMSGSLDPDWPATYYQRALLYLKKAVRDPSALRVAEDAIQQAMALEPDNPDYAVVLRRIQRRRAGFENPSEEPGK